MILKREGWSERLDSKRSTSLTAVARVAWRAVRHRATPRATLLARHLSKMIWRLLPIGNRFHRRAGRPATRLHTRQKNFSPLARLKAVLDVFAQIPHLGTRLAS